MVSMPLKCLDVQEIKKGVQYEYFVFRFSTENDSGSYCCHFRFGSAIWRNISGNTWWVLVLHHCRSVLPGDSSVITKRKSTALIVYAVLVLGTVVWGLWEVGSDFFALAPRLDILGLFGLALLIPAVTRGFGDSKAAKIALTGSLAITIAVMIYSVFNDPQEIRGELKSQQPAVHQSIPGIADEDWPAYGRTQSGLRYSPLKQITADNVKDLELAWEFHTGDVKRIKILVKLRIR